ncbi:hypothetical protein B0T24DRAFT_676684 [Lasiosphaeria ovina]|uniref:Uncharacterized protein n=1 Tax=Lasiosphaeria ovina TaxID=92902 RepID=A0AAE0KGM4_9PEZI|nr:hypothetical protein B0T24DRAFT_676684 [Lasiosphaeria ovina]
MRATDKSRALPPISTTMLQVPHHHAGGQPPRTPRASPTAADMPQISLSQITMKMLKSPHHAASQHQRPKTPKGTPRATPTATPTTTKMPLSALKMLKSPTLPSGKPRRPPTPYAAPKKMTLPPRSPAWAGHRERKKQQLPADTRNGFIVRQQLRNGYRAYRPEHICALPDNPHVRPFRCCRPWVLKKTCSFTQQLAAQPRSLHRRIQLRDKGNKSSASVFARARPHRRAFRGGKWDNIHEQLQQQNRYASGAGWRPKTGSGLTIPRGADTKLAPARADETKKTAVHGKPGKRPDLQMDTGEELAVSGVALPSDRWRDAQAPGRAARDVVIVDGAAAAAGGKVGVVETKKKAEADITLNSVAQGREGRMWPWYEMKAKKPTPPKKEKKKKTQDEAQRERKAEDNGKKIKNKKKGVRMASKADKGKAKAADDKDEGAYDAGAFECEAIERLLPFWKCECWPPCFEVEIKPWEHVADMDDGGEPWVKVAAGTVTVDGEEVEVLVEVLEWSSDEEGDETAAPVVKAADAEEEGDGEGDEEWQIINKEDAIVDEDDGGDIESWMVMIMFEDEVGESSRGA